MALIMEILYKNGTITPKMVRSTAILSPQEYTDMVNQLQRKMAREALVYQQVDNEGADYYDPNIEAIATYNIGNGYQVIFRFNNIAKFIWPNIVINCVYINLDGINTSNDDNLYTSDAIYHALFIYVWDTFKDLHNLPDIFCKYRGCIYVISDESNFCCDGCKDASRITPKCLLLREQGRKCSKKKCIVCK